MRLSGQVELKQILPLCIREASLFISGGGGGDILKTVSYGVANCALGYFGVLLLDP